ncbi:hypothetical protein ACIHFD_60865 [Nonomuraea sp. NPDC051941]|uniref:hypothetical protein n=1 Tax=Nonomuraea sp. NPDC051941 TaxID=3364373 RepID=UPI0037CB22F5
MTLQIVAGTANRALADSVAEAQGNEPAPVTAERFQALASVRTWRLIVVDPHTVALEAICAVEVEMLTAVPLLTRELGTGSLGEQEPRDGTVVVAPDRARPSAPRRRPADRSRLAKAAALLGCDEVEHRPREGFRVLEQ